MLENKSQQPEFVDFYLPFGGKLKSDNRWVRLAKKIPWNLVDKCYRESFKSTKMGAPAMSSRIAYGALIIKERFAITDRETVEQLRENPYLQYFLGISEFQQDALFDYSMMVHFRGRFTEEHHRIINNHIIDEEVKSHKNNNDDDPDIRSGKLLIDATCTPADITYPTDLKLLNEAREKSEQYIDDIYGFLKSLGKHTKKKPRTYRQRARKDYLGIAKLKRCSASKRRAGIRKQLNYVKRNLDYIETMVTIDKNVLSILSSYHYKCLLVIHTLYDQQRQMFNEELKSISDRIVSISQPHVRPIVRGKASVKVEFGAKVSISVLANGYVSVDRVSWDAYNECQDLIGQVRNYKARFGYYPESVHADKIYQNRTNRQYCKDKGIRLTGKPLGRPKKLTSENKEALTAEKLQRLQDEKDRQPVEGKFGNVKRRGTLQRIMAKLPHTSESVIHIGFLVLNLEKWLREAFFAHYLYLWRGCRIDLSKYLMIQKW